jgi:hypothetical protein
MLAALLFSLFRDRRPDPKMTMLLALLESFPRDGNSGHHSRNSNLENTAADRSAEFLFLYLRPDARHKELAPSGKYYESADFGLADPRPSSSLAGVEAGLGLDQAT